MLMYFCTCTNFVACQNAAQWSEENNIKFLFNIHIRVVVGFTKHNLCIFAIALIASPCVYVEEEKIINVLNARANKMSFEMGIFAISPRAQS